MNPAVETTCRTIEQLLKDNPASRRVDENLYVVKQGSAYVMVNVLPLGRNRAIMRCTAQLLKGVQADPQLAWKLLHLNSMLRFGAFAFVPDENRIFFIHSILGGETLDPPEVLTTIRDVALIADEYDDKIAAMYGGQRMQDLLEEKALQNIVNSNPEAFSFES